MLIFEPAGAMPTDTAVLINVSNILSELSHPVILPEQTDAVNCSLNDFGYTSAVNAIYCATVRKLSDMLWHVGNVFRVHYVCRTQLFGHLQSAIGQVHSNDLFHLEMLCSHESGQTNTPHTKNDNALVGFRLQDVECCPCSSLKPAAASCKDSHLLYLSGKLHHTRLAHDAQTGEAALTKELAFQRHAV